ncbi:hypothetical protein OU798_17725 [Prolixibacteraceae bacterium Z1-6]|uniref:Uncharacterized protein n=1 Tax=Draconibacterium aestuarii TaxID=2998507 RepID=A0A9X3FGE6_9BACT|nr:hypothetical protein [Prolixibacteraceae bacterium Z1-6]
MKKVITLFVFVATAFIAQSQPRTASPNSNWPYLLEDFSPCVILHEDGNVTKVKANYNLLNEVLQYNKNGSIMNFTDPGDIAKISFNEFVMEFVDNDYYIRISADDSKIHVYEKNKGNMNDLMESKGAYGSSTTTAATSQSIDLDIGGINSFDVRMLWDAKDRGKIFRVNNQFYFLIKNTEELIPLKKNNLLKSFPNHEKEIKSYLKQERINLSNTDDVRKITVFLNTL